MVDPRKAGKSYTLEARNPYGGAPIGVGVTQIVMDSAKARGPGAVEELKLSVPHVLKNPLSVFRGVRDRKDNRWLCYAGRPKWFYDAYARRIDSPDDEIFLVFISEGLIVYTHHWEDADPDNPDLPKGWNHRFDTRLRYDDSPAHDG